MPATTFLFHTMLAELAHDVAFGSDNVTRSTTAELDVDGRTIPLEFVWPGEGLDCLTDDCRPMVSRVLDTAYRHGASGRVGSVSCYMAPRKAPTALTDPGWLEWGVVIRDHDGERLLYVAHIQRIIGADVERHT